METIFNRFGSIKQFNDYLQAGKTNQGWLYESALDTSKDKHEDCRTWNFEEATDLMLYGDKKLLTKIENAGVYTTRLKVQKNQVRRTIYTSVVGCQPHVPNYVAGVPVAMINEKKVKVKQKIVTVFYNMAVRGDVSASAIIEACAQLISACMIIEGNGIRVNIFAGSVSRDAGQRVGFAIKIKDSGQPFDTLKMCYPMAHPSMNRRHKFRYLEVTEGVKRGWSVGYGRRCNDDATRKVLSDNGMKVDAVFNFESIEGLNAEQIADKIIGGTK